MTAKKVSVPAKKKKAHMAGGVLDFIGWGVREAALPVPDSLMPSKKKKTAKKK